MSQTKIDELFDRLESLQIELEKELERKLKEKRVLFQYTLKKGKVRFEKHIHALQRQYKKGIFPYLRDAKLTHVLSSPIVYSVIVPLVIIDLSVSFYQHTCFRLYNIQRVKRSNYIVIDRQHLAYLNVIEKLNCMYCGYGNGVMAYVREVIARTEQYWCPIKHANKITDAHHLNDHFVDYGDAQAYKDKLEDIRQLLTKK